MSNSLKCARRGSVSVFAAPLLCIALLASGSVATARTSVSAARMQAIETCTARAHAKTSSSSSGANRMRRRELLYGFLYAQQGAAAISFLRLAGGLVLY